MKPIPTLREVQDEFNRCCREYKGDTLREWTENTVKLAGMLQDYAKTGQRIELDPPKWFEGIKQIGKNGQATFAYGLDSRFPSWVLIINPNDGGWRGTYQVYPVPDETDLLITIGGKPHA